MAPRPPSSSIALPRRRLRAGGQQGSTKASPGSAPQRGTRAYDAYMERGFGQAVDYAIRLNPRPAFILTCDIGHSFHVWESFTGRTWGYGLITSNSLRQLRQRGVTAHHCQGDGPGRGAEMDITVQHRASLAKAKEPAGDGQRSTVMKSSKDPGLKLLWAIADHPWTDAQSVPGPLPARIRARKTRTRPEQSPGEARSLVVVRGNSIHLQASTEGPPWAAPAIPA